MTPYRNPVVSLQRRIDVLEGELRHERTKVVALERELATRREPISAFDVNWALAQDEDHPTRRLLMSALEQERSHPSAAVSSSDMKPDAAGIVLAGMLLLVSVLMVLVA